MSQSGLEYQFDTLVSMMRERSTLNANQNVYTFLEDGEDDVTSLTYPQFDERVRSIAARLQAAGAQGERALLLFQPGLDYIATFYACLYAGVVAVPAYPPRRNRHAKRLMNVIRDAESAFVLTSTDLEERIDSTLSPQFPDIRIIATDELEADAGDWARPDDLSADSLAFLQYTSGSTGAPKGVKLTHRNLIANIVAVQHSFGDAVYERFVTWLPPYHDMGLIGNILTPAYSGAETYLMAPVHFLRKPIRWLKAVSKYKATVSGGPNFSFDLCVRKIREEQREGLDLSHWAIAFNGAEPIRAGTLNRFADTFAPYGFRRSQYFPCYGLAEATLFVSGPTATEEPRVEAFDAKALEDDEAVRLDDVDVSGDGAIEVTDLVSSGYCALDHTLKIVDPDTREACEEGAIGEIWFRGPCVAQGYWQKPEKSERTMQATLQSGEGPYLRTGDLGFVLGDDLFVTGRIKDLIIVRGRNIYPQDIELTAEGSHEAIRKGCVAAVPDAKGQEELGLVVEIRRTHCRELDAEDVADAIRDEVAQAHQVKVASIAFLKPGRIPKTSSGKIQRHQCKKALPTSHSDAFEPLATWPATHATA